MNVPFDTILLVFSAFLAQSVKTEEYKSNRNKSHEKNQDPKQYTANTLCVNIQKEVGIDQGGCGVGDHDRGVEFQNYILNENKNHICNRESHRS